MPPYNLTFPAVGYNKNKNKFLNVDTNAFNNDTYWFDKHNIPVYNPSLIDPTNDYFSISPLLNTDNNNVSASRELGLLDAANLVNHVGTNFINDKSPSSVLRGAGYTAADIALPGLGTAMRASDSIINGASKAISNGYHNNTIDNISKVYDYIPGGKVMQIPLAVGNRLFGSKLNKSYIDSYNNELNNYNKWSSTADDYDVLSADLSRMPELSALSGAKVGSDGPGLFGMFKPNKAKKEYDLLSRKTDETNKLRSDKIDTAIGNVAANQNRNMSMNYRSNFACGGRLFDDGGNLHVNGLDFSNPLMYINEGGTHEINPNQGVPISINQQDGQPNLVEEGETIANGDYVFSNRIQIPDEVAKKLGVPKGKTFAQASKLIAKESEELPSDPIIKRALEENLMYLQTAQEQVKQSQAEQEKALQAILTGQYADGGTIHIKEQNKGLFTKVAKRAGMGTQEYARHILANKDDYSSTLVKRANFARNAAGWQHGKGGHMFQDGGENDNNNQQVVHLPGAELGVNNQYMIPTDMIIGGEGLLKDNYDGARVDESLLDGYVYNKKLNKYINPKLDRTKYPGLWTDEMWDMYGDTHGKFYNDAEWKQEEGKRYQQRQDLNKKAIFNIGAELTGLPAMYRVATNQAEDWTDYASLLPFFKVGKAAKLIDNLGGAEKVAEKLLKIEKNGYKVNKATGRIEAFGKSFKSQKGAEKYARYLKGELDKLKNKPINKNTTLSNNTKTTNLNDGYYPTESDIATAKEIANNEIKPPVVGELYEYKIGNYSFPNKRVVYDTKKDAEEFLDALHENVISPGPDEVFLTNMFPSNKVTYKQLKEARKASKQGLETAKKQGRPIDISNPVNPEDNPLVKLYKKGSQAFNNIISDAVERRKYNKQVPQIYNTRHRLLPTWANYILDNSGYIGRNLVLPGVGVAGQFLYDTFKPSSLDKKRKEIEAAGLTQEDMDNRRKQGKELTRLNGMASSLLDGTDIEDSLISFLRDNISDLKNKEDDEIKKLINASADPVPIPDVNLHTTIQSYIDQLNEAVRQEQERRKKKEEEDLPNEQETMSKKQINTNTQKPTNTQQYNNVKTNNNDNIFEGSSGTWALGGNLYDTGGHLYQTGGDDISNSPNTNEQGYIYGDADLNWDYNNWYNPFDWGDAYDQAQMINKGYSRNTAWDNLEPNDFWKNVYIPALRNNQEVRNDYIKKQKEYNPNFFTDYDSWNSVKRQQVFSNIMKGKHSFKDLASNQKAWGVGARMRARAGKRYKDEDGHWINPKDLNNYDIIDEGVTQPLDKELGAIWTDYTVRKKDNPNNNFNNRIINKNNTVDTDVSKVKRSPLPYVNDSLRYAPIGINTASLLYNTRPVDYTSADAYEQYAREIGNPVDMPISTTGSYRRRNPFDEEYITNIINQNNAANARAGYNISGGNRAMQMGAQSARDLANQQALAQNNYTAYLANRKDDEDVATFNRYTDMHNKSAINARNQALASLNSSRDIASKDALIKAALYRQSLRDQRDAAIANDLSLLSENLSGLGKEAWMENYIRKMINWGVMEPTADMLEEMKNTNGNTKSTKTTTKKSTATTTSNKKNSKRKIQSVMDYIMTPELQEGARKYKSKEREKEENKRLNMVLKTLRGEPLI